jgi:hypothetical protein
MLEYLKGTGYYSQESTMENLMDDLRDWYGGYTWDASSRVFNPFSVMSCLENKRFGNYWYHSGQPLLSSKLWDGNATYFRLFSNAYCFQGIVPALELSDVKDHAALFQGGYLTVESAVLSAGVPIYNLKCHNNDVSHSIVQEFIDWKGVLAEKDTTINSKYGSFADSFDSLDAYTC